MSKVGEPVRERIWDPLVRIVHWSLVITVVAGFLIGENMSFANIGWHFWMGYATGALLLIRIIWGFVGPAPARFSHMLTGPRQVIDYAKTVKNRSPSHWPGHNPLGALSAVALWAVLAGLVITGLCSESEDFFETAPLAGYLPSDLRLEMTGLHDDLHEILVPLVFLHLGAIAFYHFWKRENLIRPMITGWKWVRRD
ncbi:MAG: cytochrome b/b6 domain-containing protein [Pseudomonadota bacterium]